MPAITERLAGGSAGPLQAVVNCSGRQNDPDGATRTSRHGQGFNLETVADRRGGGFAQPSVRALSGLVYRLVAPAPVMAAPGSKACDGTCAGSAGGRGSSAGARTPIPPCPDCRESGNGGSRRPSAASERYRRGIA